jgi:hypothetical protein
MTKEMIEAKVKDSYTKLLKSGMFWELYPQLTGVWEEDKDFWYEEYHEQMERLKNR